MQKIDQQTKGNTEKYRGLKEAIFKIEEERKIDSGLKRRPEARAKTASKCLCG